MSLCNSICTLCPSIQSCPTDVENECENIRTCGLFNCTEIKDTENPENDSILYCFRLSLENCTGKELCNVRLELALKWKYQLASEDEGSIFQPFFSTEEISAEPEATSNMPTFVFNLNWNGDDNTLVAENFTLPTGKYVVEICVQVAKSAIEELLGVDCAFPALFPSIISLEARSAKNYSCPVQVTSLMACSPTTVVVPTQPDEE